MSNIQLGAVGDISLSSQNGNPFIAVADELSQADLVFGNLETVVQTQTGSREKSVVIDIPKDAVGYLDEADFDVVNIANNHILDNGPEGFKRTIESLKEYGIPYIGGGYGPETTSSEIIKSKGLNVGFLGYTERTSTVGLHNGFDLGILRENQDFILGRDYSLTSPIKSSAVKINVLDQNDLKQDIQTMVGQADVTVVSFHWGTENVYYPSPSQVELARTAIEYGADIVLGHHPHVLQGIEEYEDGLIFYSLGNFQYDPDVSQSDTNRSVMAKVELDQSGVQDYSIIPINIDNNATPHVVKSQSDRGSLISFVNQVSEPIRNDVITYSWWFEQIGRTHLEHNICSYRKRIRRYGITHIPELLIWLLLPFTLRCYLGITRKKIKSLFR